MKVEIILRSFKNYYEIYLVSFFVGCNSIFAFQPNPIRGFSSKKFSDKKSKIQNFRDENDHTNQTECDKSIGVTLDIILAAIRKYMVGRASGPPTLIRVKNATLHFGVPPDI